MIQYICSRIMQFIIILTNRLQNYHLPNEKETGKKTEDKFMLRYTAMRTAHTLSILLTNDKRAAKPSPFFFAQLGRYFNLVVNFIFLLKFKLVSNKYSVALR